MTSKTFKLLTPALFMGLMYLTSLSANAADGIETFPSTAVAGLPYSGVVRAGDLILVGGIAGVAPGGKELVTGGITFETRAALGHVKDMLELAGASMEDTVKCVVLLKSVEDFPKMNDVFREFFPVNPPTRSTLIVADIPMGASIELDCKAYKKSN